jgi:Flp pilus assembly protein TadD
MVGWKVSGSLTYSSVGATLRDYTAVIPVDTTAAATDYEQVIGFYQILSRSPEDRAVLMLEAVLPSSRSNVEALHAERPVAYARTTSTTVSLILNGEGR